MFHPEYGRVSAYADRINTLNYTCIWIRVAILHRVCLEFLHALRNIQYTSNVAHYTKLLAVEVDDNELKGAVFVGNTLWY